jgi:ribosomal protein S18 acetylase RimI-like enzyme
VFDQQQFCLAQQAFLYVTAQRTSHCTEARNSYFLKNVVFYILACVLPVSRSVNSAVRCFQVNTTVVTTVMKYMLTDSELMNIHVRALYTHDAKSQLLFVNEPDSKTIPAARLFLGRTRDGNVWRFRADLPDELCEQLNALCADEPPLDEEFMKLPLHLENYLRLLKPHAPEENVSNGLAYQFTEYETSSTNVIAVTEENAEILQGRFEKLIEELPTWQPFVALVKANRAVSVCRSARITPEAHEAGVETLPEFRGNGYAKDVVMEWARLVRGSCAIPLYSTSWENIASQAVARKLKLKCYGVTFEIA